MFLLKFIFQNFYYLIKNKQGRSFFFLLLTNGDRKRNKSKTINLFGGKFTYLDNMSFLFQYKEIFVDEFYFFNSNKENPLIIDCGSNIGTSCIYFFRNFPKAKVLGFEPNPQIFEMLKDNTKSLTGNLELSNEAVWVDDEGITFHFNEADSGGIYGGDKTIKVNTIRLKDVLQKYDEIDFLKIDIEGAETQVILDCGATLNRCQNIFLEYHSFGGDGQKLGEILELFEEEGFRYYIHNNAKVFRPMVNKKLTDQNMDLQLNIFATKTSD